MSDVVSRLIDDVFRLNNPSSFQLIIGRTFNSFDTKSVVFQQFLIPPALHILIF